MYESLQPLRVSAGWTVTRHLFFEEEIDPETMDTVRETLFHAMDTARRRAIDLEWVPESKQGGFYELKVVNITAIHNEHTNNLDYDHDWETPHYLLKSTNRQEIVNEINRLMWQVPVLKEERILKGPGVVDQPSESYRLKLKKVGLSEKLFEEILTQGNDKVQSMLIDHADITPNMLNTLIDSDVSKKIKNKARILLNSQRYKRAHGLWTNENPQ